MGDGTILLFYREYERDRYFRYDRYIRRAVRPVYKRFTGGQRVTGFGVWCQLLIRALQQVGHEVRLNDFRSARAHPDYPVGLVGCPQLLDGWELPNPAVLGPAMFDHPLLAPNLMMDPRFRYYLVTCEWMRRMFVPYFGGACGDWHAGIDTDDWYDLSHDDKHVDVLLYDKVRWNRDELVPSLIAPIEDELARRGLRFVTIRYGEYQHGSYQTLLGRSRSMIFLCEHETQGMAYQEALASNVPVLAWDNGYWLDPRRPEFDPEPVPATSVPYFDESCGERFKSIDQFSATLDRFLAALPQYAPRAYVQTHLSLESSAAQYLRFYNALFDVAE